MLISEKPQTENISILAFVHQRTSIITTEASLPISNLKLQADWKWLESARDI